MATNSNLKKDPDANAIVMAPDRTKLPLKDTTLRQQDTVDEQFPATYEKPSKKDPIKMAKLQMQSTPGMTPFGQLTATEDDFEWLQKKREAEELANIDQWFALNFDNMSPAQKATAKNLYPAFYERRMILLDKQIELTREIARLKLNGIQDEKDLRLQYAIEKGLIDEDPLVNILHPENSKLKIGRDERFRRGLLSRKAYPRGNWGPNKRYENAKALTGRSNAPSASMYGVDGSPFSAYGKMSSYQEQSPQNKMLLENVISGAEPVGQPVRQAVAQPAAGFNVPGGAGFGNASNN